MWGIAFIRAGDFDGNMGDIGVVAGDFVWSVGDIGAGAGDFQFYPGKNEISP